MKQKRDSQKFWNEPGVKLVLALVLPVIIVLIIVLIYFLSQPVVDSEGRIVIDNFDEVLPAVPNDTRNAIEERLYLQVDGSLTSGQVIPESGAMIREGSNEGFAVKDEFHVGDFIVDIPDVQQSYIVEYRYGELNMEGLNETEVAGTVAFYCIENPDLVRYSNFRCDAMRDFVKPDPIQYILPVNIDRCELSYTYSTSSTSGYAVILTLNPTETTYRNGQVEAFRNDKMAEVREYIQKSGLNPDNYEYIVKYKIVE